MRILIADDDPISRRMLQALAGKWGYSVEVTDDGEKALGRLTETDAPSLAVIDWMMPGIDGLEICRRLRASHTGRYVYVIVLTARTRREDLVEAMDAGADDYLSKPFHEKELEVRLRAGRRIAELEEQLRATAMHDGLTGLWNRCAVREHLENQVRRSHRDGKPVSVLVVDLDHFKRINDTHGHAAGDGVLREAASRMRGSLRPLDALGRAGGEEFLVVIPDEPAVATAIAERLRLAIAGSPVATPCGPLAVTASIGVACGQGPGLTADALVERADEALYQAKRGGRDRVAVAAQPSSSFRGSRPN